jgi:galactokinase
LENKVSNTWDNYIKGVLKIIIENHSKNIQGSDIYIYSDLLFGAGLSSSASLTTSLAFAYNNLYNLELLKFTLAKIAQDVEHKFIGTNCGPIDQMACIFSEKDTATMIDCNTYDY